LKTSFRHFYQRGTAMAKVIAVCTSKKKGTRKDRVPVGVAKENFGLENDAHADYKTHRQVSLLSTTSIEKMRKLGLNVDCGDFAENLTCEGIEVVKLPVGTRVGVGDEVVLEISQIGKECHTKCAIYRQVGTCVMPEEGVFARVIKGGSVKAGDELTVLEGKADERPRN
jgi:MOSC domain-containing protein YiiM